MLRRTELEAEDGTDAEGVGELLESLSVGGVLATLDSRDRRIGCAMRAASSAWVRPRAARRAMTIRANSS